MKDRAAACSAGQEIKDVRETFERELRDPILEAGAGIELPIGFEDIGPLLALVPVVTSLIPTAEELGRRLRAVEEELLELCAPDDEDEDPEDPDDDDEDDEDDEDDDPHPEPVIRVLGPGTPGVQDWPIVQAPDFEPEVIDGDLVLRYGERLTEEVWPGFVVEFMQEEGEPEELHHGNAWIVYSNGTAYPFEWLRRERERNETAKDVAYLLEHGRLRAGDVVGFMLTGPARHLPERREYRRRTLIRLYIWGDGKLKRAPK